MMSSKFFFLVFLLVSFTAQAQESRLPFDTSENSSRLARTALIETTQGPFEIRFYERAAPITVRSFQSLVKKGFYNNLSFHLYKENFIVQGGDPLANGKGGPGYTLPPEHSNIKHLRGTIGMARKPNPINPERRSNGSQFYICLNRAKHLDGLYTVFAEVINGIENVMRLREGDKITNVLFPRS